jgi:hypothetical protein
VFDKFAAVPAGLSSVITPAKFVYSFPVDSSNLIANADCKVRTSAVTSFSIDLPNTFFALCEGATAKIRLPFNSDNTFLIIVVLPVPPLPCSKNTDLSEFKKSFNKSIASVCPSLANTPGNNSYLLLLVEVCVFVVAC